MTGDGGDGSDDWRRAAPVVVEVPLVGPSLVPARRLAPSSCRGGWMRAQRHLGERPRAPGSLRTRLVAVVRGWRAARARCTDGRCGRAGADPAGLLVSAWNVALTMTRTRTPASPGSGWKTSRSSAASSTNPPLCGRVPGRPAADVGARRWPGVALWANPRLTCTGRNARRRPVRLQGHRARGGPRCRGAAGPVHPGCPRGPGRPPHGHGGVGQDDRRRPADADDLRAVVEVADEDDRRLADRGVFPRDRSPRSLTVIDRGRDPAGRDAVASAVGMTRGRQGAGVLFWGLPARHRVA